MRSMDCSLINNSNSLLLDQLEHVNSIQQLHKQSGPEAASVDET